MFKLTILFLTVVCLHVTAAGQKETVTISGKDLPLEKVFSMIKKQTDYVCFYGYDILRDARPVSLNFKNAEVQDVLKAALWGQGLDFSITGKTITIVKKPVVAGPTKTIKVIGAVYNEAGQPLSGANVTIKNTGKGTITNAKGQFELSGVPEESPLLISFIGYAPEVTKVSEGKALQVYLKVAKNELDKVVVQAYGTTTQRLATGNIATVTAAQIERQPVMNPLTALEGQVPGVVVTQTSGYASAPFKVEIRGRTVIDGSLPSEPLYIIDGVPLTVLSGPNGGNYLSGSTGFLQNGFAGPASGQSPFFSINPNDIESISVLKDADATAIYGSRGANGVILITTKSGKSGKTKLDISVYHGESSVTQHYNMLNTQQYLEMRREAFKNDGIQMNAGNAYDLLVWDTTRYTDWQKFVWGKMGRTTDAQLGFSGGDRQTTFRLAGGYHKETTLLTSKGSDQRGSVQFNLSHKSLDQRLNISFTSMYSYAQSDLTSTSSGAVTFAPNAPAIFTDQGDLNYQGWQPIPNVLQAYFSNVKQPYNSKTGFLNSQLKLQYEILKGLVFTAQMGYSTTHNSQYTAQPMASLNPQLNPKGSSQFGNNNNENTIIEPQIEYNRVIGKGKLSLLGGASTQAVSQDGNTIAGDGYVNDNLLHSIANAPSKTANDNFGRYRYAAAFARVNYNWADKYILNVSARRDGSSRFGPGKQYGNFGAIGAAWIFSEEGWIKDNINFLSFGKLRGSYGITGSDQIGDYQYLSQWSAAGTYPYNRTAAYVPLLINNPDLQWEVNKKFEVAINLGFFKDWSNIEVAFYRNRSSNQLVTYPLSSTAGFTYVTANFPATVQNVGWEFNFRQKLINKKDLSWVFNVQAGFNFNKLVAFPNIEQSSYASSLTIGEPLNIRRLLHYTGVDPQTGLYTFADKNHNGVVDNSYNNGLNDLYDKDLSVKLDGGGGTDFTYKNFQLNIFFRFRIQQLAGAISNYPGRLGNNQSTQVLNRWQKPGDKAVYAKFTTQNKASYNNFYFYSDGTYSNGSYLRLHNIALSYSLPPDLLKKAGIQTATIYVRGENLFVFTKYNGIDPDAPDFGLMPPMKIATAGIRITL